MKATRLVAQPSVVRLSCWEQCYRRLLPTYWVYLFCSTHFPGLKVKVGSLPIDKILHAVAFGLLAFLFWKFAETFRKPAPAWLVWLALVWIGLYAAVDEWTQQFVGRGTDPGDWLANMLGVGATLAILEWRRRVSLARSAAGPAGVQVDPRGEPR